MKYKETILDFDVRGKNVNSGRYYLTRRLFSYRAIGGNILQRMLAYFVIWLLLIICVVLDTIWELLKLTWELLKVITMLVWVRGNELIVGIVKWIGDLSKKALLIAFKWLAPVVIIFLLFSLFDSGKWKDLADVLENFWDLFF